MGIPKIDTGPMRVDDFYLLTDTRPDNEKWELIEGEPILNASPSPLHQWILKNILFALTAQERSSNVSWSVIPGIGALVSETSRPEPDLMVLPKANALSKPAQRDTDSAIVLFEIMSPSTASRDLQWKRASYTKMAALTDYVVVAQDAVDVAFFARENGFAERRLRSINDVIDFRDLGASLTLSDIYRDTGLS